MVLGLVLGQDKILTVILAEIESSSAKFCYRTADEACFGIWDDGAKESRCLEIP